MPKDLLVNMKKVCSVLFILTLISFGNYTFSQKLYIWCPKDQIIKPRISFLENDTINISIFDGRILTKNSKIECTSENTVLQLLEFIKKSYPSAVVNVLSSDAYFKDLIKNRITFKIGISAYHAGFGADVNVGFGSVGGNFSYGIIPEGKWNAVTAFAVKIYDYRNNQEIKKTKDIYKIASKSNMGGYMTAKNVLNNTYIEACQEMLFFIDESLMK
jgi:hypothetical protein